MYSKFKPLEILSFISLLCRQNSLVVIFVSTVHPHGVLYSDPKMETQLKCLEGRVIQLVIASAQRHGGLSDLLDKIEQ